MAYRENLLSARDRYAAELAAQQPPPDYSWNEYEQFLLEQLQKIQDLLDKDEASLQSSLATQADAEGEVISKGFT